MRAATARNEGSTGFGLVELLVSIALFLTIIGSVALIFNGSLRALRQAEQSQDIFEMVRGAQQVMERDLATAFSSREYGDFYQFYGTPIGFTFVGLVQADGDQEPNLARVTYVLRQDLTTVLERESSTSFVDGTADPITYDTDGIDNDGDGLVDEADEGLLLDTYSLIRYVEPGVSDLESFPIDWTAAPADFLGPSYQDVIDVAVSQSDQFGLCPPEEGNDGIDSDGDGDIDEDDEKNGECTIQMEHALKREIWIRALAGTTGYPAILEDAAYIDFDSEDFVLLENIAITNEQQAFINDALDPGVGIISTSASGQVAYDPQRFVSSARASHNGQMFQYAQWVSGNFAATITAASNAAQVQITSKRHGLETGAQIRIEGVSGLVDTGTFVDINNPSQAIPLEPVHPALTVVDQDNFTLPINTGAYTDYQEGGIIARQITNVTQANPAVVTSANHGLQNGDRIRIENVNGMTRLNSRRYTVVRLDANTFELHNDGGPVNSAQFRVYVDGGDIYRHVDVVRQNVVGFWNDYRNIDQANNGIDDDGDGVIDCLDGDELVNPGESDDGIDNDGDTFIDCLDPDELPVSLNDDGLDNDLDTFVDEGDEWLFAEGPGPGSPIDASLPSQVQVRFRLFFPSAIAGANDFERNFEFDLDVPSGFRRLGLN